MEKLLGFRSGNDKFSVRINAEFILRLSSRFFNSNVPFFEGIHVFKADEQVIHELKHVNKLIYKVN